MEIEDLSERVTDTVGGLRDRTAEAVRGDGRSVFREVRKLSRRIDHVNDEMGRQFDASEQSLSRQLKTLDGRIDSLIAARRRTGWPWRLLWVGVGVGVGVVAAYFADPDRGRARRSHLTDQAIAQGRDLGSQAAGRAKNVAARTKGKAIETAKDLMPEDVPSDPRVLEQRIKSEVFGHRADTARVILRIDAPGTVALKGTVPNVTSERELMREVAEVDGVVEVQSELSVGST